MGDSRRRGDPSVPSAGGPPRDATDEALIELVQSLPVTSARRAAAYKALVRRYDFVVRACMRATATVPNLWKT
jgi:hypothetical protein